MGPSIKAHVQAIMASVEAAEPGMSDRELAEAAAVAAERAFDECVAKVSSVIRVHRLVNLQGG